MKQKEEKIDLIFDVEDYKNDLEKYNKEWSDYWKTYYENIFKDNILFIKVKELQKQLQIYKEKILEIQIANNDFLEENILIGEELDYLKHEYNLKTLQVQDLQNTIGKKPKNFFDTAAKLIDSKAKQKELKNKVIELEVKNKQIEIEKANSTILQAISSETIERILILKSQNMSHADISKITKVSTASVSRYINKNKKRLNQLKQSNSSLITD